MILWKKVKIDLTAERTRIANVPYTVRERKLLLGVVDMIERGEFERAVKHTRTWSREHREYMGEEIWHLLFDVASGAAYVVDQTEAPTVPQDGRGVHVIADVEPRGDRKPTATGATVYKAPATGGKGTE